MEGVLAQVAKTAATDAAVKATYDEEVKKQKPETEIHARHILVATEDEAKSALKRIMGGEEFEKVAKEVSKDPGSEGGDLGCSPRIAWCRNSPMPLSSSTSAKCPIR